MEREITYIDQAFSLLVCAVLRCLYIRVSHYYSGVRLLFDLQRTDTFAFDSFSVSPFFSPFFLAPLFPLIRCALHCCVLLFRDAAAEKYCSW